MAKPLLRLREIEKLFSLREDGCKNEFLTKITKEKKK